MDSQRSRIAKPLRSGEQQSKGSTKPPAKNSNLLSSSSGNIPAVPSISRNAHSKVNNAPEKIMRPATAHQDSSGRIPVRRPSALTQRSSSAPSVRSKPQQRADAIPPVPSLKPGAGSTDRSHLGVGNTAVTGPRMKPQRNVLRRKPSTINEYTKSMRELQSRDQPKPELPMSVTTVSSSGRRPEQNPALRAPQRMFTTATPPALNTLSSSLPGNTLDPFPELSSLGINAPFAHDPRLPTPVYAAHSSSPSTRQSDSPSPWSRTSTPTSMSSHSPGIAIPSKWAPRPRLTSPTYRRPPVAWKGATTAADQEASGGADAQGLTTVRESLNSSSSGSTVKAGERGELKEKDTTRGRIPRLPPSSPSPPRNTSAKAAAAAPAGQMESRTRLGSISQGNKSQSAAILEPSPVTGPGSRRPSDASMHRELPPPRPSRDGAPTLNDDGVSIPVIQSNLSGLPFSNHRRRPSQDAPVSAPTQTLNSSTPPLTESRHTRRTSGFISSTSLPTSDGTQSGRAAAKTPIQQSTEMDHPRRPSSPHTSPGKGTSRFGFFTRRTKTGREGETSDARAKTVKKGPAAGTGHEGYGRYSTRGRSGSMASSSSRGRSTSQSTTASAGRSVTSRKSSIASKGDPELDEFFVDRLEPVVIVGGNQSTQNHTRPAPLLRPESNQSSFDRRPSLDSQASTGTEFSNFSRQSSEYSDQEPAATVNLPLGSTESSFATLPARTDDRNQWKSSEPDMSGKGALRILPPLNTNPATLCQSQTWSAALSSRILPSTNDSEFDSAAISEGREGNWLRPKMSQKTAPSPTKSDVPRRLEAPFEFSRVAEVQVKVRRHNPLRSLPHYAMLDSAEEQSMADLEDIMHEVEHFVNNDADAHLDKEQPLAEDEVIGSKSKQHVPSVLLPDPPALPPGFHNPRPASPKVMLRPAEPSASSELASQTLPSRPSRLPQVGRIPRVISTRVRKPPPESFSRPFSSVRPDMALASAKSARGGNDCPTLTESPQMMNDAASVASSSTFGHNKAVVGNEFLTFPSRKGSVFSNSSDSDFAALGATIAVIPSAEAAPGADEVWKEYDDLLDDVFSPGSGYDLRSSYGFPSQDQSMDILDALEDDIPSKPSRACLPSIKTHTPERTGAEQKLGLPHSATTFPKSQRWLDSNTTPDTPMSFTDLFAGYGERNLSCVALEAPSRDVSVSPSDQRSRTPGVVRTSNSSAESKRSGSGRSASQAENYNPVLDSETNLRFGALMTSRWLSFGRVLFSPAHDEISHASGINRHDRLLILDGLGNGKLLPLLC